MPSFRPIQKLTVVDGASRQVDLASFYDRYYVYGTAALTSNWAVTGSGTPYDGMTLRFEYRGTVTLGGNHITFMGTQMPDDYASKKVNVDCYYNGSAWVVDYTPAFDESDIISSDNIKELSGAKLTAGSVPVAKIVTLTGSRALETSAGGVIQVSATTAAEIAYLAGVTAGTSAASKAVVLSAAGKINAIDITALTLNGTLISATAAEINKLSGVTATTAEINKLAGVTAGTATALKAIVVDADKRINEIVIGALSLGVGAGTAVTATATELNKLAGCTATTTEINYLAGVVPGTATANKVAILGAGKAIDEIDITTLKIGGVAVTSTAAELNKLSGCTAVVADINQLTSKTVITTDTQATQTGQTFNADDTIIATDGFIIADIPAGGDLTLTLPDVTAFTGQVITILIRKNPNPHDLVLDAVAADTIWYSAADAAACTITTPAINSIIKVINSAAGVWVVGVGAP